MSKMFKRKPSGAMGVAFVALVAALSGTAVALPGTNTVDSGDIKNNSVRSKDLRNNDVRGKDIRAGTVTSSDLQDDGVTGTDVRESTLAKVPSAASADSASTATNATTAANAANLGGEPAGDYLNDIRMVTEVSASDSVSPKTVTADCASGEQIVGGGANIEGGTAPENIVLQDSHPDQSDPGDAFDSWVAVAVETDADAGNWTLTTYALCADG
jgi:hypothetical protein